MSKDPISAWQVLRSSVVYHNRWLQVRRDRCRTNRGNLADYYIVERPSYVMIVALTADRDVLLVEQYKHGAGRVMRELPAGYIEDGEDPLACAHRELMEETGYRASCMEPLANLIVSPSAAQHSAHMFLATGLEDMGSPNWDDNERIDVHKMPFTAAVRAVANNEVLVDLSSTAAILLAWARMQERSET